uniref:Uncharacterized protein n=1 Tax=Picea glauca TaxID=3330 RepID=A0A101LVP1_PICGL|nr:hypothetical protein ABT39_MTgene2001 [Picea glauca]QHR87490.1 hypothetical protein Q903MT_gene1501 [Picea sitchensis]
MNEKYSIDRYKMRRSWSDKLRRYLLSLCALCMCKTKPILFLSSPCVCKTSPLSRLRFFNGVLMIRSIDEVAYSCMFSYPGG